MELIRALLNTSVSKDYYTVSGIGSRFPVFARPAGSSSVRCRLGCRRSCSAAPTCRTVSGSACCGFRSCRRQAPRSSCSTSTRRSRSSTPTRMPDDRRDAESRRPGSFVESISQRFMPAPFQTIGFEIRATAARCSASRPSSRAPGSTRRPLPRSSRIWRRTTTRCSGPQRGSRPQRARVTQRHGEPHARPSPVT